MMAPIYDDKVEKSILLVRDYHELYDMSNKHYSNQIRRENIWQHVGEQIGESAENCKTKWKYLRDAFQRCSKNTTKSGQAAKSIRKWRFFNTMSVLLPYVRGREQHSNLVPDLEDENNISICDVDDPLDSLNESETLVNKTVDDAIEDIVFDVVAECSSTDRLKRKRKESTGDTVPEIFKEYIASKKLKKKEKEEDPLTEFFINMAKIVKTFPEYEQAIIKSQVFYTINSKEMELLYGKQNPSAHGSHYNSTSHNNENLQN